MNQKTVYGLDNNFDGDAEPLLTSMCKEDKDCNIEDSLPKAPQQNEDFEIIYELDTSKEEVPTWKKYIPTDLRKPITPCLNNSEHVKPQSHLNESPCSKRKIAEEGTSSETPTKKLATSRRRPTLQVKTLARSELADKYDQLLNKRLELAELLKKKVDEELITIAQERKLKLHLLKLQIEVEQEKLKKLKNNTL